MPKCELCDRDPVEHKAAEASGDVHHKFIGEGGSLEQLDPPKKNPPKPQIVSGPPIDPVLRTILIEKGVITVEDIEKAERTLQSTGVIRNHGHPDH
jgi:hypothetical protein